VHVAVVGADGVVHGDEVRAGGKGALDLDLMEGATYFREDVAASQHGGPEGHEVGDGVLAIAYQLLEVAGNECLLSIWSARCGYFRHCPDFPPSVGEGYRGFRVVEFDTSRQPPLGEETQL
jgi:hypothetical protein